ncbi:MAG: ChbG/HpnK family deacetylase, partial [Chloroflexota bacterium]
MPCPGSRKTGSRLNFKMNKQLIVNADDYGRTRGVSSGIRSAHILGIVTSTTAMMNMPGVDNYLEDA